MERNDSLRDRTWKTASGDSIRLRDMDTNHIHNCINMLRKNTRKQLEITKASSKKLRVGMAKAEATANLLKSINGAEGVGLALEIKRTYETQYNNQSGVSEKQVSKALINDTQYQAFLYEIECREKEIQAKIQAALNESSESFFETKGKVTVTKIEIRPEGIPMVVEATADATISRTIKPGDYLGVNEDIFRITYLVRRSVHNSNNDIIELTLNSRRENDKMMVQNLIKIQGEFDIY